MSLSSLRDLLNQHFCDDELRRLCFHLSIEPENLLGHTCVARAQALVEHCLHHGRLPTLGALSGTVPGRGLAGCGDASCGVGEDTGSHDGTREIARRSAR